MWFCSSHNYYSHDWWCIDNGRANSTIVPCHEDCNRYRYWAQPSMAFYSFYCQLEIANETCPCTNYYVQPQVTVWLGLTGRPTDNLYVLGYYYITYCSKEVKHHYRAHNFCRVWSYIMQEIIELNLPSISSVIHFVLFLSKSFDSPV